MKQLLVGLLIVVMSVSMSAFALSGNMAIGSHFQTGATTTAAYSYSRNSEGGLVQQVNTTSGMIVGCNTLASTVNSQGYSLKVYISSYSPKTSDSLCVTAVFHDNNATPLTLSQGADLGVSIAITDSNGDKVMSAVCHPSVPPPINGRNPTPPQGLQCGTLWDTQAPVSGISPQPGVYRISAVGSFLDPTNQTLPQISTASGANVTLTSG